MSGRDYGGRTAGQRRAERRKRLLASGLELFGTKGFRATSIDRLCSRANVSTRNFYEEFNGREALLIELLKQINEQALTAVQDALNAPDAEELPTAERVARAIAAYVHTTSDDPKKTRISYVEVVGVSRVVEAHRQEWRDRLVEVALAEAAHAVRRGDAVDRDYRLAAMAFIGAVNELVYQWILRDRPEPVEDICAELTRLALALLAGPA